VRGWVSVHVKIRGKTFRVIGTQLEFYNPLTRFAQADELLAGPANTRLPIVLLGDFNAGPGEPSYELLAGSGFTDLVLFRDNFGARVADVVGEAAADRTESGLWPSDHAGVVATLSLP
jgi:endonuclease/exonuclease/phosphatase family metal-dependent hydrolase